MKKSLFLFSLLTASPALADIIIHNDSDESMLVNLHTKGVFFSGSDKIMVLAHSIGQISTNAFDAIKYLSFTIQSGPLRGIGGKLELAKEGYSFTDKMGRKSGYLFNRLQSFPHIITINIQNGLPSVSRIDFLNKTVPNSWWKVSHSPQETARAQEILRNQMVTPAACEKVTK